MDIALLVGRIVFGGYFLMNAYNHLAKGGHMVGYAQSKGVPAPRLAIAGSGLLLLAGGLSIVLGYMVAAGVVALLLFLIPVTFVMHAYWKISDPMARSAESIAFYKNVALMGAALMVLAIPEPWAYSI